VLKIFLLCSSISSIKEKQGKVWLPHHLSILVAMLKREVPIATVQTPRESNHSGGRARGEIFAFFTILSPCVTLLNTPLKAKEEYGTKARENQRLRIPVNQNRRATQTNSHG
jgi:hypothetical protein